MPECSEPLLSSAIRRHVLLPSDIHCYRKPRFAEVYCEWKTTMAAENLADVISSLTPQEQESVKQFVDF